MKTSFAEAPRSELEDAVRLQLRLSVPKSKARICTCLRCWVSTLKKVVTEEKMFWVSPVVHNHASYTLATAMRGCLGNACNKAGIKELPLHLVVALSSASELLDLNATL